MKTLIKVKIADTTFRLCSWLKDNRFITFNENSYNLFVTKEKAEKVTKELMKKGKINEKEAKALVNKVAKEIDKTRARIETDVRKEIQRMMKEQKKKRKR